MVSNKAASVPLARKPKSLSKTRSAGAKGFSVQFPLFQPKVLPPLGSEQRPLSHLSIPGSKKSKSKSSPKTLAKPKSNPNQGYDPFAYLFSSGGSTKPKSNQNQAYDPLASSWLEHPLGSEQRPKSHLSISKSKSKKSKTRSKTRMSVQFPLFKPKTNAPKAEKRKTQSR